MSNGSPIYSLLFGNALAWALFILTVLATSGSNHDIFDMISTFAGLVRRVRVRVRVRVIGGWRGEGRSMYSDSYGDGRKQHYYCDR